MKKLIVIFIISLSILNAADWPMFRGSGHNSISNENNWNPQAITEESNIIWKINIGTGYSTVTTSNGMLYTVGNTENQDNLYCLDEKTGKEVWKYSYPYDLENRFPGPRSTPIIHNDKVFHFSRQGDLFCLDAKTGKEVWRKSAVTDFGLKVKHWGLCSSPYIHDNILMMNIGDGGLAVNKDTGELIWKSEDNIGHGYSTPVIYQEGNEHIAVLFNQDNVYGINIKTGKLKGSHPWPTKYGNSISDAIIIGENIFISQGYQMGCALINFGEGDPKELWRNDKMNNHLGTSIYVNGFIYGPDGSAGFKKGKKTGKLVSMDPKTGDVIWSKTIGFSSLLYADNKLIILVESGELIISDITNNKYTEIAKAKVLDASKKNPCWTMPVLSNGKIYCRNYDGDLVCIDVSK